MFTAEVMSGSWKSWPIWFLLFAYVFFVSTLFLNFLQLLSLVIWPFDKTLFRKVNYYLAYASWCRKFFSQLDAVWFLINTCVYIYSMYALVFCFCNAHRYHTYILLLLRPKCSIWLDCFDYIEIVLFIFLFSIGLYFLFYHDQDFQINCVT